MEKLDLTIRTSNKIDRIRQAAKDIHESVNQEYGEHPYIFHLDNTYAIMLEHVDWYNVPDAFIPVLGFAAYFHDTIEDARMTYNDVYKKAVELLEDEEMAKTATEIVYAVTNEKGRTREERANDKYYQGIRDTMGAPFIKCCDRLANIIYSEDTSSSMFKKYIKEMPHFLKSVLNTGFEDRLYKVAPSIIGVFNYFMTAYNED